MKTINPDKDKPIIAVILPALRFLYELSEYLSGFSLYKRFEELLIARAIIPVIIPIKP